MASPAPEPGTPQPGGPGTINPRLLLLLALVALGILAYFNRFMQDDAFISFRYAAHLAEGQGLVFNPGERVEGYTNFLWTLLLGLAVRLGVDPLAAAYALGLTAFLGTLLCTYRLARILFDSDAFALLTVVLLGTNYTFNAYATGGLETMLQTLIVTWSALVVVRAAREDMYSTTTLLNLSILLCAALLVRLDSGIFVAALFLYLLAHIRRASGSPTKWTRDAVVTLGPLVVIMSVYLAWKWNYYGALLPNTFHVKVASSVSLYRGIEYMGRFLYSYWLIPILLFLPVGLHRMRPWKREVWLLLALISTWGLYVIAVGGDFMEFRFLVPALPFAFILVTLTVQSFPGRIVRVGLVALVLAGSLVHARTFAGTQIIESKARLLGHLTNPREQWARIGQVLAEHFGDSGCRPVIATMACGAIPYYSELVTVDMLGLNDAWVARHGALRDWGPGHQRVASHAYLAERGVHFVLGHPQVDLQSMAFWRGAYLPQELERFGLVEIQEQLIPAGARVVEIPLDETYKLSVLYLKPERCIDAVLARQGWNALPVILKGR